MGIAALPRTAAPPAGFPCRLCGGNDLRLYYTLGNDGRYRYYRCGTCGLVNYDLADGLDQAQYTTEFIDPRDDHDRRNLDKDQSFRALSRYVQPPGRLLDIGAGTGRLLYVAKRAGWDVAGLELSPEMAAFAAARVGAPVTSADFLAADPGPAGAGAWDVVVLRHVLEHLPDPRLAMARIRALLKPGGHLLLEMPNVEGLAKQWGRIATRTGLHRRRFDPAMVPGHCCEYSRRSLAALADRSGFRLRAWGTYSKKPLTNWLLNRVPLGTKARAILVRDAAP